MIRDDASHSLTQKMLPVLTKKRKTAIRALLVMCLILTASSCLANTSYTIFDLGTFNGHGVNSPGGLGTDGKVAIWFASCPIGDSFPCWNIFNPATDTTTFTASAPAFAFDNGIPCRWKPSAVPSTPSAGPISSRVWHKIGHSFLSPRRPKTVTY